MMDTGAIIAWATRDKFSLAECEELAKDLGAFNTMTFDLVGPKGRKPAKWIDAYYGFFQLDGAEDFMSVSQFKYAHELWCENLRWPDCHDASGMEAPSGGETSTEIEGSTGGDSPTGNAGDAQ